MPESPLRLVKRSVEFTPKDRLKFLPRELRGVYVLYKERLDRGVIKYDVFVCWHGNRWPARRHAWPPNFSRKVQTEGGVVDTFFGIRGLG